TSAWACCAADHCSHRREPCAHAGGPLDLNDIHFHDSRLVRVVEVAETHDLLFEVEYPVDWENNRYEPRAIAFLDVLKYRVEEIAFAGAPTLLGATDNGTVFVSWRGVTFTDATEAPDGEPGSTYRSVILQTSAGTRSLLYKGVDLRPCVATP
ncbi:MAG TPA: hypothetical protein VF796_14755, partial [Humisphaera sp.]